MNYLDTEFIEDGHTIDLVSIGMVCEDGRELYRCSTEAKLHLANDWVRANVLPKLPPYGHEAWQSRGRIASDVRALVLDTLEPGDEPEIWAYYADYDWVALCQLFGAIVNLPKGFPMWCRDLKQLSWMMGSPTHPPAPRGAHDALVDARWNRDLHLFLLGMGRDYAADPGRL